MSTTEAYNRYVAKNPKAQAVFNQLAAQARESGENVGPRKILEAMRKQLNVGADNGLASDFARVAMGQDDRLDGYFQLKSKDESAEASEPVKKQGKVATAEPDDVSEAIAPAQPVDVASLPKEKAKKGKFAEDGPSAIGNKVAKRLNARDEDAGKPAKGEKAAKSEKPKAEKAPRTPRADKCTNCCSPQVVAKDRCNACYTCLKRKGHERPLALEEKRLAREAKASADGEGQKTPA